MLSPNCGIRAQIFRMELKILAFLAVGMPGRAVIGRNSATGSPRRSITIMPPSATSRTNSEVWIWSSRTEVFLICYIVALPNFDTRAGLSPRASLPPFQAQGRSFTPLLYFPR